MGGAAVALVIVVLAVVALVTASRSDDSAAPGPAQTRLATDGPTGDRAPAPTADAAVEPVASSSTVMTASTVAAISPPPTVPGPFSGPISSLTLGPGNGPPAVVATATVPIVSVYAQPLTAPLPASATWTFDATTQFGSTTVFLVTGTAGDFVRVLLPLKPNGTEGWVHNSEVALSPNGLRFVVDLAQRRVSLFDGPSLLEQSIAGIGAPATPTPSGTYYVTDLLRTDEPDGVYGPYILAISARSDSFELFNGGEPIVALHGTNNPGQLGGAPSAGCIRLPNEVATRLVSLVPPGTPVYIS